MFNNAVNYNKISFNSIIATVEINNESYHSKLAVYCYSSWSYRHMSRDYITKHFDAEKCN